jgi:hypothetical protein
MLKEITKEEDTELTRISTLNVKTAERHLD